jgi:hypothetical protein
VPLALCRANRFEVALRLLSLLLHEPLLRLCGTPGLVRRSSGAQRSAPGLLLGAVLLLGALLGQVGLQLGGPPRRSLVPGPGERAQRHRPEQRGEQQPWPIAIDRILLDRIKIGSTGEIWKAKTFDELRRFLLTSAPSFNREALRRFMRSTFVGSTGA